MAENNSYEEYLLLNGTAKNSRVALSPSFGKSYHYPSGRRQKIRLDGKFQALQSDFKLSKRGAKLAVGPEGAIPDQVIVLEIIGDVLDFINAAKKIDGLDLQFELSADEIQADTDFYDSEQEDEDHTVKTKMFLILSNQDALRKIIVLWNQWKRAPNKSFSRGLNKWRDLFQRLHDVRIWSDQDRLAETGILNYWAEQVQAKKELIFSEIELWFSSENEKRISFESSIRNIIVGLGGELVSSTVIPEIRYHGLIAKIPSTSISHFLTGDLGALKEKSPVMFFRPCAQAIVSTSDTAAKEDAKLIALKAPQKPPRCLILDGFPMSNHNSLQSWVNVNDLFGFASLCPPADRKHGTAVSSLVIHGEDLLGAKPIPYKVVVTPILKPEVVSLSGRKAELVPENFNILDLVHQAVVKNIEQFPQIKIVNFSIGISGRPFNQIVSPLARLIDWLSWKHQITFIISAGNCTDDIQIDSANWNTFSPIQRKDHVMTSIFKDMRNRKILSPAESFNGLSVGALHSDNQNPTIPSPLVDPSHDSHISPITRFGPGIRRSLKPEIYFPGGRQLMHNVLPGQSHLRVTDYNAAPGILTAVPGNSGSVTGTSFQRGTSFSAALASHHGLRVLDFLDQQRAAGKIIPQEYDHLLVKALLVNSSDTVDFIQKTKSFLESFGLGTYAAAEMSFALSGYGKAQPERTLGCNDYRVTGVAVGSVQHEKSIEYIFPIPDNLGGKRGLRRVTTTLAWSSAVNANSQRYRASAIFTDMVGLNKIACERSGVYEKPSRRGSIEHCVYGGETAVSFAQNSNLVISVNCREDGMKMIAPVPFAFVVTMETAEADDIKIFQQVKTRIQSQVRTRA